MNFTRKTAQFLVSTARICLLGPLGLAAPLQAAETYRPTRVDPLSEHWRWLPFETLPDIKIRDMQQDGSGALWFALNDGVARYDGRTWTRFTAAEMGASSRAFSIIPAGDKQVYAITERAVFFFDGENWNKRSEHTISLNFIYDITHPGFLAHDGSVWITHHDGIDHIDGDRVERFRGLGEIYSTIFQERSGALWLVSLDGSVYRCRLENQDLPPKSKWSLMRPSQGQTAKGSALLEARDGRIWLIDSDHRSPVSVYDPIADSWQDIRLDRFGGVNRVQSIIESIDGKIWISGYSNLHVFDGSDWAIYQSPEYKVPDGESILFQSQDGFLWLGEQMQFIQRIDISDAMGRTFQRLQFQCEDEAGDRWYLEIDGRLVKENARTGKWSAFGLLDGIIDSPVAMISASNGWLWVAGTHQGAAAVNAFDGSRWQRFLHPEFATIMGHMALLETASGDILFGADQHPDMKLPGSGGLLRYRKTDLGFESEILSVPHVPYQIPKIEETADGTLWFGGVFLKKFDGKSTTRMHSDNNETSGWIDFITAAPDGSLWSAIWGSGALRLKDDQWKLFNEQDGLNSALVSHFLTLQDGSLCCVTDQGLFRFENERWAEFGFPKNFLLNRGYGTIKQSQDGSIWINQGNRAWYKRGLYSDESQPPSNQQFLATQYLPDTEAPSTIDLQRFQNADTASKSTFIWSGSDAWSRTPADGIRYAYRLDDGEWSPFNANTSAAVEGLSQGDHRFEVRARDRDFNIETSAAILDFSVSFPIWRQSWFIALLALLALSIVFLIVILVRIRIRHIIELEEMKIQFFTNISHELRTPLSLILGPLESIRPGITSAKDERSKISIALANAKRLNDLINQLLDFRKEDVVKREPQLTKGDLIEFTQEIVTGFRYLAQSANQELVFSGQFGSCLCSFPQDALQKTLDNLIANAIKYTPSGGRIEVSLTVNTDGDSIESVEFVIEDTGPGIPKDRQEIVFQPFVRAQRDSGKKIVGTGIGLALAKQLIERCHGSIRLESPIHTDKRPEHGTRFTVHLPLRGTVEYTPASGEPLSLALANRETERPASSLQSTAFSNYDDEVVLVIEDNQDLARFIESELSEHFAVILASNGKEGLQLAKQRVPSIIITDYLMPEMDGFEVCRQIRAERTTSHIPIIVLTALKSDDLEQRGLSAGANEFLTKPFSSIALALRIRNQLEIQRRYALNFQTAIVSQATQPEAGRSPDQRFIEKTRSIAEERLNDVNFTIESLARELGMSRTQFYRKFKAITDVSPAVFLRTLRMERAATLLQQDDLTIAEVAEKSGYSEGSNFSKAFKEHFGHSPSERK